MPTKSPKQPDPDGQLTPKIGGPSGTQHVTFLMYMLGLVFMVWLMQGLIQSFTVRTVSYSEFKTYLANHEVTECVISEDEITGLIQPRSETAPSQTSEPSVEGSSPAPATNESSEAGTEAARKSTGAFPFRTVRVDDPHLVEQLESLGVKFVGKRPAAWTSFLLIWLFPIALLILLWSYIGRRVGAAGESLLSIGKSKARLVADRETGVSFQDVAGCDEAKFELEEVVEFLKHPAAYRELGAKIPKGVLLVGPPGTGKTLLARAVAGEAQVPFYSLSGSDFVEMFVGVGAARVRDLFQQAKQQAPCIVFIDELDAIGRQRGVHVGAVNDEREQTLNQLLSEMDGFEPNAGVIILSATNRPEILDRALLRPGRFDRQIVVDAPDLDGREAILKVHSKDKPLAHDVNLRQVAQATAGFSGADLANALNEAALLAARRKAHKITQDDLESAVEKVVTGPERKSRRLGDEEKRRVAHHEVGHALVAAYSKHADPVHKISIIPRGRAALGYTLQLPTEDQFLLSQSDLSGRIRVMLGGRAAEELIFGDVTTGAQNDLEHATALARQMVCLYGMSDVIGLTQCALRPAAFLDTPETALQRDCSEQTAREIDQEVKKILDRAYSEAREVLAQHRDQLEAVAAELLKVETLDGQRFHELIGLPPPESIAKPPAAVSKRRRAAAKKPETPARSGT